jgi:hypothetical protein
MSRIVIGGRRAGRHWDILEAERISGKLGWWWLSFADAGLPKGSQFLGCCIVEGYGIITAVQRAHELGIDPGGGVMGIDIPNDLLHQFPESYRDRLLTRQETEELGPMVNERGPG